MTLADIPRDDLYIGMEVRVRRRAEHYRLNSNRRVTVDTTERLRITALFSESLTVRTVDTKYNFYSGRNEHMSFSMRFDELEPFDPNAPAPRRLGKKPEDTEDMQYIGIDHPGIQWLFEDMGKYADEQGYCSQYDALTARLGIPGRPRDFTVQYKVGEYTTTSTIKARSQREANELFEQAMLEALGDNPQFTPAA